MSTSRYQIYGLEENYLELGSYLFKLVVNPRYANGNDFSVELYDAALRPVRYKLHRWGRKLNVEFVIDDGVSDGVMIVSVIKGKETVGHKRVWVCKP